MPAYTKEGSRVEFRGQTDVGYYLTFTHECGSEANAAAWLALLQQRQDREASYEANKKEQLEIRARELENEVFRLKRRVQYHKRQTKKALKK